MRHYFLSVIGKKCPGLPTATTALTQMPQPMHEWYQETLITNLGYIKDIFLLPIVKLRQGSGKDRQGMALKAKGLKA